MSVAAPPRPFEVLVSMAQHSLSNHAAKRLDVPSGLERCSGRGQQTLSATRWSLNSGAAELRWVRIVSPKVDVLNLMGFPGDASELPVLTIELLALGAENTMAFLDLQDAGLGQKRASGVLHQTQAVRAHLTAGETPEPWALAYSQGASWFTRCATPEGRAQASAGCLDYFNLWLDLVARSSSRPSGTDPRLADFKAHQLAHTPGVAFLSGVFGPEWAERFLHSYLYA